MTKRSNRKASIFSSPVNQPVFYSPFDNDITGRTFFPLSALLSTPPVFPLRSLHSSLQKKPQLRKALEEKYGIDEHVRSKVCVVCFQPQRALLQTTIVEHIGRGLYLQYLSRWTAENAKHTSANIDNRVMTLRTATSIQPNQPTLNRGLMELQRIETIDVNGCLPKQGRATERFGCECPAFGAMTVDSEHGFGHGFDCDGPTGARAGVNDRKRS
mmetsp:Transcript_25439/g.73584  ORF Transcript_25439/g.73584 Transcript_25439/m.73584 type:complete len:214 (-) Transcript_25439:63-704(-)